MRYMIGKWAKWRGGILNNVVIHFLHNSSVQFSNMLTFIYPPHPHSRDAEKYLLIKMLVNNGKK